MTPKNENTIHIRHWALALGIALLLMLDIGIARGADPQASLPPAPLRPDAETEPTKISVGIWASDISKIDSASQTSGTLSCWSQTTMDPSSGRSPKRLR